MALFRTSSQNEPEPESPTLLFRDLQKDSSIKYLWSHQDHLVEAYFRKHLDDKNLAIELPTGSGKTLVGLLIAEYLRRAKKERVVFLCPTRQLCFQVEAQAKKYGISALKVLPRTPEETGNLIKYQQAKAIAITTYSGIFNTNPKISDPQVIICDDAHAADSYVSSFYTVKITRQEHEEAFRSIFLTLRSIIPEGMAHEIEYFRGIYHDRSAVELLSPIQLFDKLQSIREIITEYSDTPSINYPWQNIKDHLECCTIFCSPNSFEIKPIISPTLTHPPFANARQRIYMSATLGEDGGIERSFGVKRIARLPIPEGWDKRGTGRRLLLFPGLSGDDRFELEVAMGVVNNSQRSLILVPNKASAQEFRNNIAPGFQVMGASDIEQDIENFTNASNAVLILTNRYDGIDLPGDACRVVILNGLPAAASLQENFLQYQLGAASHLRDKVRTRVTQAIGRCTRDEGDYSVVIVVGQDIVKWLATDANRDGMHPEFQAEVLFGFDNSTDQGKTTFTELVRAFLSRSDEWAPAEVDIRQRRSSLKKVKDDIADSLARASDYEIEYTYKAWDGQHEQALVLALKVLEAIQGGSNLRPYSSFWHHQAAVSAFLAWKHSGREELRAKVLEQIDKASRTSRGQSWLGKIYLQLTGTRIREEEILPFTASWFFNVNSRIEAWGLAGGKFARNIQKFRGGIEATDATKFEEALNVLGSMLGAKTHVWKDMGAPDGLWMFGDKVAFVFEAKTDATPDNPVPLDTVRQARLHEERVRNDKLISEHTPCYTVLISPSGSIDSLARPHAGDIRFIEPSQLADVFNRCARVMEVLRANAAQDSEEELYDRAVTLFSEHSVSPTKIFGLLTANKLADL